MDNPHFSYITKLKNKTLASRVPEAILSKRETIKKFFMLGLELEEAKHQIKAKCYSRGSLEEATSLNTDRYLFMSELEVGRDKMTE
jgi:hypothetical protein